MNDEQILKKAIGIAINNGWERGRHITINGKLLTMWDGDKKINISVEAIIYSHDFAEAFWGERDFEEDYEEDFEEDTEDSCDWRFHLQKLVLQKEPLNYIEKFLNK